jgi:hypothetical protein
MKLLLLVSLMMLVTGTPLYADPASDAATAAQTAAETAARNAAAARAAAAAIARKARLLELHEKTMRQDAETLMDEADRKKRRDGVSVPAVPEAPFIPPFPKKPAQ